MSLSEILEKARNRAKQMGLPYNGALTPAEASEVLKHAPNAKLVDVRTRAEWEHVGRIPGAIEIELLTDPGRRPNPAFMQDLERQVAKESPVLFICRSGARSNNAAMLAIQAGYNEAYNVIEGVEGDKDNPKNGWQAAGLPWVQP